MNIRMILAYRRETECPICLDTIELSSKQITPCNHVFHKACLSQIRSNTCPICRQIITEPPLSPFTLQWGLQYESDEEDEDVVTSLQFLRQEVERVERQSNADQTTLESNMRMFASINELLAQQPLPPSLAQSTIHN